MRKSYLALAAVAGALAPGGAASAKTEPAVWVNRILGEWEQIQSSEGWAAAGEIRPGTLASGGEARLVYPLAAGIDYRFVVVCEPGCGAGEVELVDPAGARVGDPKPLVEMPKLQATPAAAGNYTLRVAMTDCSGEACAWSARLYSKGPAAHARRR
jgi:hypothetical protein